MRMRTLVSAAALTAVTITPVVATEGSADAASVRTWDRIAHCESGGRWHISTGNGYYGGLQISPSTWRGYGGKKFARLPHQATKREQIRIAERIQDGQGWGAWPSCA
jgi:hypothetical protein